MSPARPAYEALTGYVRARRALPIAAERQRIRTAARVSLRDAGRVLGVSAMTVMRWEKGLAHPKDEHVEPYARLLRDLAAALGEVPA